MGSLLVFEFLSFKVVFSDLSDKRVLAHSSVRSFFSPFMDLTKTQSTLLKLKQAIIYIQCGQDKKQIH